MNAFLKKNMLTQTIQQNNVTKQQYLGNNEQKYIHLQHINSNILSQVLGPWAHYWARPVGPASHSVLGLCTS